MKKATLEQRKGSNKSSVKVKVHTYEGKYFVLAVRTAELCGKPTNRFTSTPGVTSEFCRSFVTSVGLTRRHQLEKTARHTDLALCFCISDISRERSDCIEIYYIYIYLYEESGRVC